MTAPLRPYMMGYGYGMGQAGEGNDYFGSPDPGKEPAGGMPSVGNRTQGMDAGFMGPMGRNPDQGFTAHELPGAFNPMTGMHNRPDIDLGGGYHMPYGATPEGRQGGSAQELMESGLLPN